MAGVSVRIWQWCGVGKRRRLKSSKFKVEREEQPRTHHSKPKIGEHFTRQKALLPRRLNRFLCSHFVHLLYRKIEEIEWYGFSYGQLGGNISQVAIED
jgi:hypothetical protein